MSFDTDFRRHESTSEWIHTNFSLQARKCQDPRAVPSIRTLLNHVDNPLDSASAVHTIPPKVVPKADQHVDNRSACSGSTSIPSCESPIGNGFESGSSQSSTRSSSPSPSHDFWGTVLGPTQATRNIIQQQERKFSNEDMEDKPFACSRCSFRFRKRCNLVSHINNVHERLRPFCCSVCLRRFARKSNCGKHVSHNPFL